MDSLLPAGATSSSIRPRCASRTARPSLAGPFEVMARPPSIILGRCVAHGSESGDGVLSLDLRARAGLPDQGTPSSICEPNALRRLQDVRRSGCSASFNEMYGLNYVALRYFNVYGPRMDLHGKYTEVMIRWMERIASGLPPIIFGDGLQTMDMVHVRDVALANVLAAELDASDVVLEYRQRYGDLAPRPCAPACGERSDAPILRRCMKRSARSILCRDGSQTSRRRLASSDSAHDRTRRRNSRSRCLVDRRAR